MVVALQSSGGFWSGDRHSVLVAMLRYQCEIICISDASVTPDVYVDFTVHPDEWRCKWCVWTACFPGYVMTHLDALTYFLLTNELRRFGNQGRPVSQAAV